jgi:DNA-binding CsgD family transcriptional regulator
MLAAVREPSAADPAARFELLRQARRQHDEGALGDAWESVSAVADLSRRAEDPVTLADAATLIRPSHNFAMMARVHELCAEALTRLGGADPVRSARLRAQLVATSDPFGPDRVELSGDSDVDDPETSFLRLRARHAERLNPTHIGERLVLADAAIDLGRRTGVDEYVCWGRRWRMDAYAELGNRLDLTAELAALTPLVERLDKPAWQVHLLLVKASARLLEGRFAEAAVLNDTALAVGGPDSEAGFWHLIFRATLARMTGEDADEVEQQVRRAVDELPYLARGWLAVQLRSAGKRQETAWEWKALMPHLKRMPERATEWLIATVGNAEVCAWLGDVDSAPVLYDQLLPYAGLQAIGVAYGPYEGPVALSLGRLAVLLGWEEEGRRHLHAALRSCEDQRALPHLALTHAELATAYGLGSRVGQEHAETAARLARRLGMHPLATELAAQLTASRRSEPSLTRRELEIAALVADGLSNAAIGHRLTLSERTVENHVSHILHKLGRTSRAAVASWYTSRATNPNG